MIKKDRLQEERQICICHPRIATSEIGYCTCGSGWIPDELDDDRMMQRRYGTIMADMTTDVASDLAIGVAYADMVSQADTS